MFSVKRTTISAAIGFIIYLTILALTQSERAIEPTNMLLLASIFIFSLAIKTKSKLEHLLKIFLIATICIIPVLQTTLGDSIYLVEHLPSSSAVTTWYTLNLIAILFILFFSRAKLPITNREENLKSLSPDPIRVARSAYVMMIISLLALLYIYFKFGGYSGIVDAYKLRLELGVAEYDVLEGMGLQQALANTLPLWIFVIINLRWRKNKLLVILSFIQLPILSWLASGVFGNRQGVVFTTLFALIIYHFYVARIPPPTQRKILASFFALALMMIPIKFGIDLDDISDINKNFSEKRNLDLSLGPISFLLFRDLSRYDVQLHVIDKIESGYEYSLGRSFVGALSIFIPRSIWPNRPETFSLEKTELLSSVEYTHSSKTTLLLGMPAEFLVNFGYVSYVFSFLIPLAIARFCSSIFSNGNIRIIPIGAVLAPVPFLFFLFDSNVIVYYLVRWLLLFALPLSLMIDIPAKQSRQRRVIEI